MGLEIVQIHNFGDELLMTVKPISLKNDLITHKISTILSQKICRQNQIRFLPQNILKNQSFILRAGRTQLMISGFYEEKTIDIICWINWQLLKGKTLKFYVIIILNTL